MWKFSHWIFNLVAASQRFIERRLTRAGMLVGSVLIGTAALGIDTNLTVAYRIFAFTAALLVVGWAATLLQRGRFSAERHLPRVVTAGEPFSYRVTLNNLAAAPRDGLALIDDLADPRPPLAEFRARMRFPTYRQWKRLISERKACVVDETALPEFAPRGTLEVTVRGEALRRGNQHFHGIIIARADPLGLVRGLTQVAAPANVLVLPRRYTLPPVALPGSRRYQPGGVALAASIGNSEEFVGLRDYRPGDPLQRIHWKSYARAGEPVVREYQDEYFERHALILDTFAGSQQAAAFEDAVSIASSLACTVNTQECLLDLMFVGGESYIYTAGRGQMGSSWTSEPDKNLIMSILVIQNNSNLKDIFDFNVMVAVSIYEILELYQIPELRIKWPNDILINERKVCGILVEGASSGAQALRLIVGIGVNLNHKSFPPEIIETATSLFLQLGQMVNVAEFRDRLLARLAHWYAQWQQGYSTQIIARWQTLSPWPP